MLYELQIEWGLTDTEFGDLDVRKVNKIIEYRQAKSEGEDRYQKSIKK